MRVGLVVFWMTLMIAPLIAERSAHVAAASKAVPLVQQHADASVYGSQASLRGVAMEGKRP